jgi:hypothetical protein
MCWNVDASSIFLSYFVDIPFFISKIFNFYLDWTLLGT